MIEPDALRPQVRQGMLAEQEHAGEIHVERVAPVILGEHIDGGEGGDRRRVRHHDVDPAERLDRRLHSSPYRGGIADIARRGTRLSARVVQVGGDGGGRGSIDVETLHRGAFSRERPRDRGADSPARAGDHRDLAFQSLHVPVLFRSGRNGRSGSHWARPAAASTIRASRAASRGVRFDLLLDPSPYRALCDVEIEASLEIDPELGRRPEISAEAQRGIGRHGSSAKDDIVQPRARNLERPGKPVHAERHRRQELLSQNFPPDESAGAAGRIPHPRCRHAAGPDPHV